MTALKLFAVYVFIINIVAFIIMGYDKHQAKKHKWRVSENTLMFLAFIFGAIGSLAGMYTFRHKTKHIKFKIGFPLMLVSNIIMAYFLVMTFWV